MNILHLRASNFYGGPERQLHFHARHARGSDFSITIGSFTEKGRPPEFLDVIAKDDIDTTLFRVKNAYDPKAISAVRNYLKNNNTCILCTHDYRSHLIGWLACRHISTRCIAFSRGWTQENIKVRLYHAVDRVILRFADHIIAVSAAQKRQLVRLFIAGEKISVVHNAIEPQYLNSIEKVDLRSKYGFTSNTMVYIAAGRFSREKGQIYLVKAAAVAIKQNPQLRFVLLGDGPDLSKVRNIVANLGCEGKILCPGFEKNLIGCIKGADVLVNPSLSEGLPNVVLEAMALGIPVVATAVGGVPEIITDQQTGRLVPPKDTEALTEGLLFMARHTELAWKFTINALKFVRDDLTFDKQNRRLTEVFQKVLS